MSLYNELVEATGQAAVAARSDIAALLGTEGSQAVLDRAAERDFSQRGLFGRGR